MNNQNIITRNEALKNGLTYYFTGNPCKNGHIDFRFVCNCRCKTCLFESKKKWKEENKEKYKLQNKKDVKKRKDLNYQQEQKKRKEEKKISKNKAIKEGLLHYTLSYPCKNGHCAPRRVYDDKCSQCVKERQQKYLKKNEKHFKKIAKEYRIENKEYIKKLNKKYYEKNKEILKEKIKEYKRKNKKYLKKKHKEWETKNKDYCRFYKIKLYQKNRIKIRKRVNNKIKQAKINNPEKFKLLNTEREKNRQRVKSKIMKQQVANMLIAQNYQCNNPYCKKDISNDYHTDHIIPTSKGGKHIIENIQLLCPSCNSSKNNKDWDIWLQEQKELQEFKPKLQAYAK